MKHVGIVAVSAEGAALCYRTICLEGAAVLGPHEHPEISLHGFSLGRYQHLIHGDRWDAVGEMMLESAARLVRSGAQLLTCAVDPHSRGSLRRGSPARLQAARYSRHALPDGRFGVSVQACAGRHRL